MATKLHSPLPDDAPNTTAGERWQQSFLPTQRWAHFAARVQSRYGDGEAPFAALAARVGGNTSPADQTDQARTGEAEALIAAAEAPATGLPPEVEGSSSFWLDARLKQFLAGLLHLRLPPVQIYTSQAADALTRRYGVDALTYGNQILFRSGQYRPSERAGMALLGHELTHVAQARLVQDREVAAPVRVEQERQALTNEGWVCSAPVEGYVPYPPIRPAAPVPRLGYSPPPPIRSLAVPKPKPIAQSSPTVTPQAALSSRTVPPPPPTPDLNTAATTLSPQQLNQIKDAIYRDLMDRLRTEFERGG